MSELPESQTTLEIRKVLQAFINTTSEELSVGDLSHEFLFPMGSLYPILAQLEERGWLSSRWESAERPQSPQRRLYRLTEVGRRMSVDKLSQPSTLARPGEGTERRSVPSMDSDRRAQEAFHHFLQMDPKPSVQETYRLLSQESRKLFSISAAEQTRLAEAIGELPDHQRRAIKLHLSGLSYLQIAQQAGAPSERVLEDLADAYARIRLRLV